MERVYLKIGETEFKDGLTPALITPETETIKTEERSIDGTMNVDVVARKMKLQIDWNLLSSVQMQTVMRFAESTQINPVTYIDAATGAEKEIPAYPGDISYTPYFSGETLMWRDVSLKMIEV